MLVSIRKTLMMIPAVRRSLRVFVMRDWRSMPSINGITVTPVSKPERPRANFGKSTSEILPQWPLYLAGWGHEMFARAIRSSNYGIRGKPGTLDLWCAIYLPICDRFVTNDDGQYRALRVLNVLNKRFFETPTKTHVLRYERFKEELAGV